MSYASMLAEKRAELNAQAHRIIDPVVAAKRDFTVTERRDFDRLTAQLKGLADVSDTLGERRATTAVSEAALRDLADTPAGLRTAFKSAETRELEDKFRSAILEKNPAPIEVHDAAPRSYYQPGLEARALAIGGSTAYAGVGFHNQLLMNLVETSSVLKAGATVINTQTGEPIRVPRQTAYGSASLVTEGSVIPEGDPTVSGVTLGAFKYGEIITVSNELAEDAAFDLSGYLATQAGVALGNALGADLINGVGTTAPRGVILDASLGVTGPVGTTVSLGAQGTGGQGTDLLNSLWGSLAEPYTRSHAAGFLCRTSTLTGIRNLKGTTGDLVGNQYLSQSPAPFYVDPFVPAMAANAKSILFGDWSRVFVRIVNGVRFEVSRDYAFNTDSTTFRAVLRADGALVDTTGAIKWFANSAT